MKFILLLLYALCLSVAPAANATRLEQPYTAEVPVASQSTVDRHNAQREGLLLVLERLGGQRLDNNERIKAALPQAENYVLQFSYLQDKPAIPADVSAAWRIRLVFSQSLVNQLLAEAAVPLWPLERPQILLLLANEQGVLLPVPIMDGDDAIGRLLSQGQTRGLPLLVPDPAAQDITVAAAVQSLDVSALTSLMQQMKADALLLGSLRGSDASGWTGQWLLQYQGQEHAFQKKEATFTALVDAALRDCASHLSGIYRNSTTADTGPAQLRIQVDGVASYADYNTLYQYLEKLDAVQRMGDASINGTTVILDVEVKGKESFRNLVALSRSLQWREEILPPADSDPSLRPVWRYQWSQ